MHQDPKRDPEERAFTGQADRPPAQPDEQTDENRERLPKPGADSPGREGQSEPLTDESFPNLPGYGG